MPAALSQGKAVRTRQHPAWMSRDLLPVLRRSSAEFRMNNLTTLAAALTYYGVMAAVPGLILLFIALGYAGTNVTHSVSVQVIKVAPDRAGTSSRA